jgi:hypothetical protein
MMKRGSIWVGYAPNERDDPDERWLPPVRRFPLDRGCQRRVGSRNVVQRAEQVRVHRRVSRNGFHADLGERVDSRLVAEVEPCLSDATSVRGIGIPDGQRSSVKPNPITPGHAAKRSHLDAALSQSRVLACRPAPVRQIGARQRGTVPRGTHKGNRRGGAERSSSGANTAAAMDRIHHHGRLGVGSDGIADCATPDQALHWRLMPRPLFYSGGVVRRCPPPPMARRMPAMERARLRRKRLH